MYKTAKIPFLEKRGLIFIIVGIKSFDRMTGRIQDEKVQYQCHISHLRNVYTRYHLPINICQESERGKRDQVTIIMKISTDISAFQLRFHLSRVNG
jgi:hypothetical protein